MKIVTAVLTVGAVILGAVAGACKENPRAVSAAVMLGIGTLAFQIAMFAFGVIMTIFLIVLVLSLISGMGAGC